MQKAAFTAALGLVAAFAFGQTASAQVLEIADDGTVTTHAAPAVYTDPGAVPAPIVQASPRAAPAPGPRVSMSEAIRQAAEGSGVSSMVVEAVAWQESRFNPAAVSPKGAVGVMQLMPETARAYGVDPWDAEANLRAGAAHLAGLLKEFDGNLTMALAAYNAGSGAVRRYAGVPPFPETRAYVDAILNRLAESVALEGAQ